MKTYREAQLNHVDPDKNRIPESIKIQVMSDSGSTKWMNISYEAFSVITGFLLVDEGERDPYIPVFSRKATNGFDSNDIALISGGV
jgi:hypothetical protein